MLTIGELEEKLSSAPAAKWISIKKAIACQFSGCFELFCKEYNLLDDWIVFYRSVHCESTYHQKLENISIIEKITDDRLPEIENFERGSFEALSAARALQKADEKSYREGVGGFCHFLGGINILLRNLDLDWIDPSTELDSILVKYYKHYIDFLSEKISEANLMAISSFFGIHEIVIEIWPKSLR